MLGSVKCVDIDFHKSVVGEQDGVFRLVPGLDTGCDGGRGEPISAFLTADKTNVTGSNRRLILAVRRGRFQPRFVQRHGAAI